MTHLEQRTDDNTTERWVKVAGYPGYEVSDSGLLRSWHRPVGRGWKPGPPPYTLLGGRDKDGYRRMVLVGVGCRKSVKLHAVVMAAFGPAQPFNGAVTRHLDGNLDNNSIANLAWGTQQENIRDRHQLGRTHNQISEANVARILSLREQGLPYEKIALAVGCSLGGARLVVKRQGRSHAS